MQVRPAPSNGRPSPDFSNLPPAIAESLAKLAGRPAGGPAPQAPPEIADADGKPPAA